MVELIRQGRKHWPRKAGEAPGCLRHLLEINGQR